MVTRPVEAAGPAALVASAGRTVAAGAEVAAAHVAVDEAAFEAWRRRRAADSHATRRAEDESALATAAGVDDAIHQCGRRVDDENPSGFGGDALEEVALGAEPVRQPETLE